MNKQEKLDWITEAKIAILSVGINNLTDLDEHFIRLYNLRYSQIKNRG